MFTAVLFTSQIQIYQNACSIKGEMEKTILGDAKDG